MSGAEGRDLTAVRGAAVLVWVVAAGSGMPALPVARQLLGRRELPMVLGLFRAYGGGFFERFSPESFAALLGLFVGLSVIESFVGWLLWTGSRVGGLLALVLLPLQAVFWLGFALPLPPIFAVVRVMLLAVGWRSLR